MLDQSRNNDRLVDDFQQFLAVTKPPLHTLSFQSDPRKIKEARTGNGLSCSFPYLHPTSPVPSNAGRETEHLTTTRTAEEQRYSRPPPRGSPAPWQPSLRRRSASSSWCRREAPTGTRRGPPPARPSPSRYRSRSSADCSPMASRRTHQRPGSWQRKDGIVESSSSLTSITTPTTPIELTRMAKTTCQ